ncbi:MAG: cysteine desulfurase [Verrucomicrobiae bacterium]|nr:cysteine desulfurase [Verrucomicrobiae bacterium]
MAREAGSGTREAQEKHARPSPGALDEVRLRRDFPILDQALNGRPLVYFDNAATTQKPRAVLDALQRYYEHDNSNVHRGIHTLSNRATALFEGARKRTAAFFNARAAAEIVFTRGTTESINLVASSWGAANLKAGDEILLTEMEHHSNIVPWQLIAKRTGAVLKFLPVTGDDGALRLDRLDEFLTKKVKILSFTHISNSLGTVNPVQEICRKARAAGVATLLDAAQSAGHCPVDVQQIGCDFLACSGHKMCGPTGIGVLYGRRELLEAMDPYQGGGEMISRVDWNESTWNEVPHKFEAGTPDIAGVVGLHAALDYLDGVGRDKIFEHDRAIAQAAYDRLSEFPGIRLFGPAKGRSGVVSFLLERTHAHDIATIADEFGVALRAGHHCNQPLMRRLGVASTARASFYFYNTEAELDRLVEALKRVQELFKA